MDFSGGFSSSDYGGLLHQENCLVPEGVANLDAAFLLTVGSFLLTVELFYLQLIISAFLLTILAFLLTILAFCLQF